MSLTRKNIGKMLQEIWAVVRGYDRAFLKRHRLLILLLIMLSFFAFATSFFLSAQLLVAPTSSSVTKSSLAAESARNPRACTSSGSEIFQHLTRPIDVMKAFRQQMNAVFDEHEQLLTDPSRWTCVSSSAGVEPAMPALKALAGKLSGWKVRVAANVYETKPVTFGNYPSILLEFEREYECKLAELQNVTLGTAKEGDDGDGSESKPLYLTTLVERAGTNWLTLEEEKMRARIALERTLAAYRSYDLVVPLTSRLQCLIRLQLDMRSEMSLLADAVSCVPRIWDAVTSLHDRSPTSRYNP